MTYQKQTFFYISLFFILPIIAFWKNFDFTTINQTFFDVEFLGFYYPDFALGSKLFGHFKDMTWDPYNLLGLPLIGGGDRIGIFYPVKFVFYLISTFLHPNYRVYLITYFSLFHLSLAGIFTYIFSNRILKFSKFAAFIAGIIYMFNGTFIFFGVLPNHLVGTVFLPIILYFFYKSVDQKKLYYAILAGIFISPVLLSGYTPVFVYNNLFVLLFLSLFFLRNKKSLFTIIPIMALANLVAILLSSAVLLPNLENAAISEREKLNIIGSSYYFFHPINLLYYFFPYLFGKGGFSNHVYGYTGVIPIVLAYVAARHSKAKYVKYFLLLGFIFFVLSIGNNTFLHDIAYKIIPKYADFRRPAFLHYIIGFILAILAGTGVDLIQNGVTKIRQARSELYLITKMIIFLLGLTVVARITYYQNQLLEPAQTVIIISLLFFLSGLFLLFVTGIRNKFIKVLLVFIILLDLFTFISKAPNSNSEIDPRIFNGTNNVTSWLRDNTKNDSSRVFMPELSARYNSANFDIYQIGGYYGLTPRTYGLLSAPFLSTDPGWIDAESKFLDLVNVKYIATSKKLELLEDSNVKLAETHKIQSDDFRKFITASGAMIDPGTEIFVYENLNRLPRVFLVNTVIFAKDDKEAETFINKTDFSKAVVLTDPVESDQLEKSFSVKSNLDGSKVNISEYKNYEVIIEVSTPSPAILVLSDTYYPGWNVLVDGRKKELLKADVALRGVYIDKGTHTISFIYYPKKLYLGIIISTITATLVLAYIVKSRRK